MASCRTGRIPLNGDPLIHDALIPGALWNLKIAHLGKLTIFLAVMYKVKFSHKFLQYKGPDNPFARIRHRRFPGGALAFGWGNNGLNRDCNVLEHECWAGYQGKEYTY